MTLPIWAQTNEAQSLLARIKRNPPTVSIGDDLSAFSGRRYDGTRAEALRAIFYQFYSHLTDWVETARADVPAGRPQPALYGERHDAVARYLREFGPDAVIARTLGDAQ